MKTLGICFVLFVLAGLQTVSGKAKTLRVAAPDDLFGVAELAAMVHCTPNAIYVMRSRGEGPPAYRVGKRLLFSRSESLAWVAEHREDRAAASA